MECKFVKPYTFEDESYEGVTLDLDGLRGSDITEAYRQYSAAGNFSGMVSTDPNFCVRLAAAASNQPLEFFENLPAPDFIYVTQSVQNFLLSSGLVNAGSTAKSEKSASSSAGKRKQA